VNDVATGLVAQGLSIYQALRAALGGAPNGESSNGGAQPDSHETLAGGEAAKATSSSRTSDRRE
jgi:hypothetical protein